MGVVLAPEARAADEPVTPRVQLRHDLRIDIPATGTLIGAWLTWAALREEIVGTRCRWCDGEPGEINSVDGWFRDAFRRPQGEAASVYSHILAYGVGPAALGGLNIAAAISDRRTDEVSLNVLLATEGTFAALVVTDGLKTLIARERPEEHAITDEDERRATLEKAESLLSFPSGHTTAVFAMTAASGTIASMRGYRIAPAIWIAGVTLGIATAYARIAADRHYFTDTVAGAAVGLMVGGGVPYLFHRPRTDTSPVARFMQGARIGTARIPNGHMLNVMWAF